MRTRPAPLIRLLAGLLLAWLALNAAASAVAPCCLEVEVCCLPTSSVQACSACAALPAVLAESGRHWPALLAAPATGRCGWPPSIEARRPWKPPD